jgi:hypothetical protein
MRYVFQEQVTSDGGPLELTFDDAGALLLDAGPNGQDLVLAAAEWIDPFVEPLSAENREFVRTHGRWTAFDVSSEPGFSTIIGSAALHAAEIRNPDDRIVGLELTFPNAVLRAEVDFDELTVDVVG